MRLPALPLLAALGLVLSVGPGPLLAFNLSGERWPAGSVTMHLQLGPLSGSLLDGAPSWGAVAEDALANWNRNLSSVRFVVVRDSTTGVARGNSTNNVFFSSTVYGSAWGGRTLGITLQTFDQRTRRYVETDVLFNSTVPWDSYRGAVRRTAGGANLNDFRRVAIHEFGHALGLDHPDDIGQSVSAVMNSLTSDVDAPTADDIAGARAIYENSAAATSILGFFGSSGYSTLGTSLTWRIGGVRNDGDATSGALRLQLWATTQRFTNTVPAGAHLLGSLPLDAPLAPATSVSNLNATTTYTPPPNGSYFITMVLTEATAGGSTFVIRDSLEFSTILNVGPPSAPAIALQPASVSGTAGAAATFTVSATGTLPLSYQWRKDGVALPGATAPSLTLPSLSSANVGT